MLAPETEALAKYLKRRDFVTKIENSIVHFAVRGKLTEGNYKPGNTVTLM